MSFPEITNRSGDTWHDMDTVYVYTIRHGIIRVYFSRVQVQHDTHVG